MTAATPLPPKARKRVRTATRHQKHAIQHADGPLQLALSQLADAIHNLTAPQPAMHNNHITWIDSRYRQLLDAITGQRHGHHHNQPSSVMPLWVDGLKLKIEIDKGTAEWDTGPTTPHRLQQTLHHPWRPQDSEHMTDITDTIQKWVKKIDDLFAPKPIYLRGHACPRCGQDHAYRLNDEGERAWTPALAVNADGAWCNACHDAFHPPLLGAMLGYHIQGLTAS